MVRNVKDVTAADAVRRSSRKGAGNHPTRDAQYTLEAPEEVADVNGHKSVGAKKPLEEISEEASWQPDRVSKPGKVRSSSTSRHSPRHPTRHSKRKNIDEADEDFIVSHAEGDEQTAVRRSSRKGKGSKLAENIRRLIYVLLWSSTLYVVAVVLRLIAWYNHL